MRPGVICRHVADGHEEPLCVENGEPLVENDSGWTLTCGREHENSELLVVDLDRFLERDPELQQLGVTLAEGWMATREYPGDVWIQQPIPPEDEQEAA